MKYLKYLFVSILLLGLSYLIAAFIAWDIAFILDLPEWHWTFRLLIAFWVIIVQVLTISILEKNPVLGEYESKIRNRKKER